MERTKKVVISIDINGEYCGEECKYNKSPAQFVVRCYLFNYEKLKSAISFKVYRCEKCLKEFGK